MDEKEKMFHVVLSYTATAVIDIQASSAEEAKSFAEGNVALNGIDNEFHDTVNKFVVTEEDIIVTTVKEI